MSLEEAVDSIERVNKAINLEEPDRVPVAPLIGYEAARFFGITIEEFFVDRKKAERAYEYTIDKLGGIDMVMPPSTYIDFYSPLSPSYSLYYCDWKLPGKELSGNVMPQFNEKPIMDEDGYDLLINEGLTHFLNLRKAGFWDLLKFFKAMRRNKAFYRKWFYERRVPMVSDTFTMLPFDTLALMRGLTIFLTDLYRRPEKVIEASDAMIDGLIALGEFPIKGLSGKIIFQGSQQASAEIISSSQFEKFCLPYLKRMTEEFAKDGFISHLHNHGNWTPSLKYLEDFPKKKCILYLDDKTDISKAKEILGDRMCLMGNIRASILSLGTPKKVEKATKKIIDGCADGGGLIISCENPPDAQFENLKALVDTTKKYGVYRA